MYKWVKTVSLPAQRDHSALSSFCSCASDIPVFPSTNRYTLNELCGKKAETFQDSPGDGDLSSPLSSEPKLMLWTIDQTSSTSDLTASLHHKTTHCSAANSCLVIEAKGCDKLAVKFHRKHQWIVKPTSQARQDRYTNIVPLHHHRIT